MPIFSSSLLTTRNFISHALLFLSSVSTVDTALSEPDLPCVVALCTSSSFMNGSLAPEAFMMLQESARHWPLFSDLSMIMVEFSSTIQFVTEVNMKSLLASDHSFHPWAHFHAQKFFFKMTSDTRYFIRQCETVRLVLSFTSNLIFETCLPRMTALRKLVIGPEDYFFTAKVIIPNSVPESELVTALTAARNLDTLELNFQCTVNMTDETLENVWKVNSMPYLRSLRIGGCNLSPISDLSCIPKYHPKLTSLEIQWCSIDKAEGRANGFAVNDNILTPPDLTLLPELRNFGFIFEDFCEDGMFDHLIPQQKRREGHYLKYLSSLKIKFACGDADTISSFIKNFDGSLVREFDVSFVIPEGNERHVFDNDDEIEHLTQQFPLIEELSIDCNRNTTGNIFRSIANNSISLKRISLPRRSSSRMITDKNMAFLFDPAKCVGGVFRTLEELSMGSTGADDDDDDDQEDEESKTIRGLNWFGSGLKDGAKHYCLKQLFLGVRQILDAEGFAQICSAFAHCLEWLSMHAELKGLLSETKTVMPVMKKLEHVTVYGVAPNMKENLGMLVKNCVSLGGISLTDFVNSPDMDTFNADDVVSSIAENFVDRENNMLTLDLHAFGPRRKDGSSCSFSAKCQQKISQLKSLRNIQSSKEVDWSVLKEARPDIKITSF